MSDCGWNAAQEKDKVTLVNLTGNHLIGIDIAGRTYNVEYSGRMARVNFNQLIVDNIDTDYGPLRIYRNGDGLIKQLPAPTPNTIYIVSRLVAEYAKRPDVVCPNKAMGHVRRNEFGMPIAVDSLLTYV